MAWVIFAGGLLLLLGWVLSLVASGLSPVATALSRCSVVIYCEQHIPTMIVDNRSDSVVIVRQRASGSGTDPGVVDESGDVAAGRSEMGVILTTLGADQCSTERIVALDRAGAEVASRDRVCDGDTWVIPAVPGRTLSQHVPRAALPPHQVEVRILVELTDYNHPIAWLRRVDEDTANLRQALAASGAGSVEGPYEERFSMVFYLYGSDPERLLDEARSALFQVARPDDAYADVSQPGQSATPTGVRENLLPPRPRPGYRVPHVTPPPGHRGGKGA